MRWLFLIRHARRLPTVLRHREEFLLGFREGNGYDGMTYDDDPWSPRSVAYDVGRDVRRGGR